MAKSKQTIIDNILRSYGRTFSEELGIPIENNTPSALFRLLVFALLSSTRISHQAALNAAKALSQKGWKTPQKMAAATWRQRTDVLNRSGYARYDESTSRMLEQTADILLEDYKGVVLFDFIFSISPSDRITCAFSFYYLSHNCPVLMSFRRRPEPRLFLDAPG